MERIDECMRLMKEVEGLYERNRGRGWGPVCAPAVAWLCIYHREDYARYPENAYGFFDLARCHRRPRRNICYPVEVNEKLVAAAMVLADQFGWSTAHKLAQADYTGFFALEDSDEWQARLAARAAHEILDDALERWGGGSMAKAAKTRGYREDLRRARYVAVILYTLMKLTGMETEEYDPFDMEMRYVYKLGRMVLVEFCKHNIYVWSPVRRYRLPANPARIIDVLYNALKEAMKIDRIVVEYTGEEW